MSFSAAARYGVPEPVLESRGEIALPAIHLPLARVRDQVQDLLSLHPGSVAVPLACCGAQCGGDEEGVCVAIEFSAGIF